MYRFNNHWSMLKGSFWKDWFFVLAKTWSSISRKSPGSAHDNLHVLIKRGREANLIRIMKWDDQGIWILKMREVSTILYGIDFDIHLKCNWSNINESNIIGDENYGLQRWYVYLLISSQILMIDISSDVNNARMNTELFVNIVRLFKQLLRIPTEIKLHVQHRKSTPTCIIAVHTLM